MLIMKYTCHTSIYNLKFITFTIQKMHGKQSLNSINQPNAASTVQLTRKKPMLDVAFRKLAAQCGCAAVASHMTGIMYAIGCILNELHSVIAAR
jgi:hypothetical protein